MLNVARLAPDWSAQRPLDDLESKSLQRELARLWRWNLVCAIAHGVQAVAALVIGE